MHREFNENDMPFDSDTRGRAEKTHNPRTNDSLSIIFLISK